MQDLEHAPRLGFYKFVLIRPQVARIRAHTNNIEKKHPASQCQKSDGHLLLTFQRILHNEANIQNIIGQEQRQQQIKWKCFLLQLPKRRLDVHQLLDSLLIEDHLRDIFIIILYCQIEGKFSIKCSDISLTASQQQFLNNTTVA